MTRTNSSHAEPDASSLDDVPPELTRSIALEEAYVPTVLRSAVLLSGAMLTAFVIWAGVSRIDEVAIALGEVVPSGYVQSIQHLEGGIVRKIMVEDGQLVEKGQSLVQMDDTAARADLGQMQARRKSLALQAARLRQFVDSRSGLDVALTGDEKEILQSMRDARASQQKVIQEQIAQKHKELAALQSTSRALEKNIVLANEELAMHRKMANDGYGSRLMVMTSEREVNQLRGQIDEIANQQRAARNSIQEAQNRLLSLSADLKQEAMKTLGQVEAELAEVDEALSKAKNKLLRTVVTSPVRGIVKGLDIYTVGAVIEPGKVMMEVVPIDQRMMIEAMVSPRDIAHLRPGQPAKVKVSAFDFSRYGYAMGRLQSISASTFQNEDGDSFYKVRLALDQDYIGRNRVANKILPGMIVQADIISGDKTILQYLLKPLHVAASNALHER